MRSTRRAADLLSEGGWKHLLKRAYKYYWRKVSLFPQTVKSLMIAYRGVHELSVDGASARFHVDNRKEAEKLTRNYKSELVVYRDLLSSIEPGDVFWDVGANIGSYTCLVADVVNTRVVAFEPSPENADELRRNVEINGLDVEVYEYALSDSEGSVKLRPYLPGGDPGVGLHKPKFVREDTQEIQVDVVTGDGFRKSLSMNYPQVLKIDVEGMEFEALRGMSGILSDNRCRLVYCEVHGDRLSEEDREGVHNILRESGFEVERLKDRGGNYHVKGVKA